MPRIFKTDSPARTPRIDWNEFADCRARVCVFGKDFFGSIDTMQHRARHAAERRGMRATTWADGADVVVQFKAVPKARKQQIKK